jgi:hypothetical protein
MFPEERQRETESDQRYVPVQLYVKSLSKAMDKAKADLGARHGDV